MRSHAARGYSCFASDADLRANLEAFVRRAAAPAAGSAAAGTPVALFASVEDAALLRGPALRDFNLSSLASLGAAASAARREHGLALPDGIAASPSRAPCHRPSSAPAPPRRAPRGSGHVAPGTPRAKARGTAPPATAWGARSSRAAASPSHRPAAAFGRPGIATVLLDQLTCARAQWLLLNAFSTYSQLIMGRVGMQHPDAIGWTRDLTAQQQRRTGVSVEFWRTQYWATRYTYVHPLSNKS